MGFFNDIIVIVGDCSGGGGRGVTDHDKQTLLNVWANFVYIVKEGEYNSSQLCCGCLRACDFLDKKESLRRKICYDCPANNGQDFLFDRDWSAPMHFFYHVCYRMAHKGESAPVYSPEKYTTALLKAPRPVQ